MDIHRFSSLAFLFLGTAAALGPHGFAATEEPKPDSPPSVLRWADLRRLIDNQPVLKVAEEQITAAQAEAREARLPGDPEVDLRWSRATDRETRIAAGQWSVEFSYPLDWIATRGFQRQAGEAGVAASQAEARAIRWERLRELKTLFWTIAGDQALIAVLEETERQTSQLAWLVRHRTEHGEARPSEAPRAEIELMRLRNELGMARSRSSAHRAQLELLLGRPLPVEFRVEADLAAIEPLPPRAQLLEQIGAQHPELQAAAARWRRSQAESAAEQRRRWPKLAVTTFTETELDARGRGIGLSLGIPLPSRGRAKVARSRAEAAAAEQRGHAARIQLQSAAIEAYEQCSEGGRAVSRYREEILPRAEEVTRTIEKTFEVGETSLIDLLDARRTILAVRTEFQQALLQHQLDCTELAALTGGIDND